MNVLGRPRLRANNEEAGEGSEKKVRAPKQSSMEKRRKEEAELRILIHTEIEKTRTLVSTVQLNETTIADLTTEYDAMSESHAAEVLQLKAERSRWDRRLKERAQNLAVTREKLEALRQRVQDAGRADNDSRLILTERFIRRDMKPDFSEHEE